MIELHVTCTDETEAVNIAQAALGARLIACANIVGSVRSLYRWEGVLQDDREILLIAKTADDRADAAEAFIAKRHSYDVPAIVRHSAVSANEDYARWVEKETR